MVRGERGVRGSGRVGVARATDASSTGPFDYDPRMTLLRSDSTNVSQRRRDAEACAVLSVMLAVAVFTAIVVARGVGGHLDRPLSGWAAFVVYLGMTVITGGAFWWRSCLDRESLRNPPLGFLLIACVCPLLTAMILGRDLSAGSLTFFLLLTFLIAGGYIWLAVQAMPSLFRQVHESTTQQAQPTTQPTPAVAIKRETPPSTPDASPALSDAPPNTDHETFSQRWTRREGDMGDELEGTLRIYFAVGQRTATADIPIVPAMASIPSVDCEPMQASDADVQVIVRGVHTYGVRLELQRPAHRDAAEEIEVAVLIHAERSEKFEV